MPTPQPRTWTADALERILWTFVQASIGTVGAEALAAGALDGNTSILRAAAVGGLASCLSLIKTVAARRIGDPDDASTLPHR